MARNKLSNEKVAVKIINVPNDSEDESESEEDPETTYREKQIMREVKALKKIGTGNPFVVNILDVFEVEETSQIWIVMEYLENGDMFEYLGLLIQFAIMPFVI